MGSPEARGARRGPGVRAPLAAPPPRRRDRRSWRTDTPQRSPAAGASTRSQVGLAARFRTSVRTPASAGVHGASTPERVTSPIPPWQVSLTNCYRPVTASHEGPAVHGTLVLGPSDM